MDLDGEGVKDRLMILKILSGKRRRLKQRQDLSIAFEVRPFPTFDSKFTLMPLKYKMHLIAFFSCSRAIFGELATSFSVISV